MCALLALTMISRLPLPRSAMVLGVMSNNLARAPVVISCPCMD